MEALGRHLVADYWDCTSEHLRDRDFLEALMLRAAVAAETTVMSHTFFVTDTGVSGVVVVSESHLSLHTDAEKRSACVDIFTCGCSVPEGPRSHQGRPGSRVGESGPLLPRWK